MAACSRLYVSSIRQKKAPNQANNPKNTSKNTELLLINALIRSDKRHSNQHIFNFNMSIASFTRTVSHTFLPLFGIFATLFPDKGANTWKIPESLKNAINALNVQKCFECFQMPAKHAASQNVNDLSSFSLFDILSSSSLLTISLRVFAGFLFAVTLRGESLAKIFAILFIKDYCLSVFVD